MPDRTRHGTDGEEDAGCGGMDTNEVVRREAKQTAVMGNVGVMQVWLQA